MSRHPSGRAAGWRAPAFALACAFALGSGCSDDPQDPPVTSPATGQAAGTPAPGPAAPSAAGAAGVMAGAAGNGNAGAGIAGGGTAGAGASGAVPAGGSGAAGQGATPNAGGPAAGSGGDAGAEPPAPDAGPGGTLAPVLPPVTSVETDGSFATMQNLAGGPSGRSGLFHPRELGAGGLKHPIFVWGCGGGSRPASYAMHLNRIASHGFVVIAEVSAIGDNGKPLTEAIDWLLAENARMGSIFFGKLDPERIAAGGHSIGSVNTFLMASDPRLRTTIHVAGGSLDNVNDPSAPTTGKGGKSLIHPVAYVCSASDLFGNVEKTEKDYAATTVPAFFTIIAGSDHVAATADGLPAILAWLRWQLGGEEARRADFLEPGGAFQTGKYASKTKNW